MKRKHRTIEELDEILRRDSALQSLRDILPTIDNVILQPDGKGACVFKTYLSGRTGPYESFLWLHTPFDKSYVCWEHQRGHAKDICQTLFAAHVKTPSNDNGSYLTNGVTVDEIICTVKQYARHCGPMFPLMAKDLEPPERVETTTYRILRDTSLAQRLKELHRHECQICEFTIRLPDGSRYAEAHHVQPLGSPHHGPDVAGNIIVVCPNHHAMCDYGAIALNADDLKSNPDHHVDKRFIDYHNSTIHSPILPK